MCALVGERILWVFTNSRQHFCLRQLTPDTFLDGAPTFPSLCFWIREGALWVFKRSFVIYSMRARVSSGTCKAQRDTVCGWDRGCWLQSLYGAKLYLYVRIFGHFASVRVCPRAYVSYSCVLAGRKKCLFLKTHPPSALKIIKIHRVEGAFISHYFPSV